MNKNQKLKEFYNKVYLKGEEKHFSNFVVMDSRSEVDNAILNEINWKNKKVLDVGCGTGLFAFLVAKKGANVLGIDYSDAAIKEASKKYKHSNLTYKKFDVSKKFSDKFDIVVSIGTLEHMNNPLQMLKKFKKHLKPKGKIIVTVPNWINPRGYVLMTLYYLFNAPITLADLHYLSPMDFVDWSKKLKMNLKWKTLNHSWASGDFLVLDFKRRLPNVLADAKLPNDKVRISKFIKWLEKNVISLEKSLPQNGAMGLYIFSLK